MSPGKDRSYQTARADQIDWDQAEANKLDEEVKRQEEADRAGQNPNRNASPGPNPR